ncbi:MAG: DUF1850 domain-containing protein [Treponema sp.]|nr:DUF1850 domain-containing protein [Treponema sp.]
MQHYYSRQAYKDGFVISYTHSVNKGRVHDYYRLCGNKRLELYQTDFVSYGAGIPEAEETPGAVFEVNGDNYSIKNLNRCLDRLVMAVGLIANHSISFGDSREYKMTSLFPAQTSIVFEYKKISLAAYAFGKKIKG